MVRCQTPSVVSQVTIGADLLLVAEGRGRAAADKPVRGVVEISSSYEDGW